MRHAYRGAQGTIHKQHVGWKGAVMQASPVAAGLLGDLLQCPLRHVQVRHVAAAPARVGGGVVGVVAGAPAQDSMPLSTEATPHQQHPSWCSASMTCVRPTKHKTVKWQMESARTHVSTILTFTLPEVRQRPVRS